MDWKDALSSLRSEMPEPQAEEKNKDTEATQNSDSESAKRKRVLTLFYETKGRAGKPATIIAGFDEEDDAEAADVARTLKQKLGCGGSSRGGEILLQGDRRQKARELLSKMGYKLKN